MISISFHCTLLLALAGLLLSSGLCKRSAPAAVAASPSPPPFNASAPACPPALLIPSCSMQIPPASAWPPFADPFDMTSPLFNQSCLFLLTNLSSSHSFTIAFSDQLLLDPPPALSFALFRSQPHSIPFMEINFNFSVPDSCAPDFAGSLLATCEAATQSNSTTPFCKPSVDHSESDLFNYSVSLTLNGASSPSLLVQAEVNYGAGGFEIKQNSTYWQQPDLDDAYRGQDDDSIGLFVSYVTEGEATINISTTLNDVPPPYISSSDSLPPHENHSKSSHTKVVLWVVVGVSMVAFVVAVMILALGIKKLYRGRPPLVRSHLAGGHVAPPSTTTRAPFPHPHRESSATPMMATVCLSPPYHANNFQTSGTTTWLKQPDPR